MNETPLYTGTREQARKDGLVKLWRESFKANVECKIAIESAIRRGFDGMHLAHGCASGVLDEFGTERVRGDVASAVQSTWTAASEQIKSVVNNVVFPALDMILVIFFFVKLGSAYFDYRQGNRFDWAPPAILFVCLVFTLTAPTYIWTIIGA